MLDAIRTFRFQISIPTAGTFLGALLGTWVVGALIDHRQRFLTLGAIILSATAVLILGLGRSEPIAVYVGVAVWGLAFGGVATLFQTASAKAALVWSLLPLLVVAFFIARSTDAIGAVRGVRLA